MNSRWRIAMTVVFLLASGARPASAQDADVLESEEPPDRVALLGAWLESHATQQKKERRFTGATSLVAGLVATGAGTVLFVDDSISGLARGIGIAAMSLGAVGVATGITKLSMKSTGEKRLRRWQAELDAGSGIDERELARFEGEFRADVAHARRLRIVTRWIGVGIAAGGALVIGMTPVADLSGGSRTTAYVTGGVLLGTGILNIAFSFMMTPPEKAWRDYSRGKMPSGDTGLFGVVPSIGPHHAGFTVRRGF